MIHFVMYLPEDHGIQEEDDGVWQAEENAELSPASTPMRPQKTSIQACGRGFNDGSTKTKPNPRGSSKHEG